VKLRYVERLAKAHYVKYDQNTNVVIFDYLGQSNMTTSTGSKHMDTKGLPGTEMKIEKKRETERFIDGPRPPDRGLGESPSDSEVEPFSLQAGRPRPLLEHGLPARSQKEPYTHEIAELVNRLLAPKLGTVLNPEDESGKRILSTVADALGEATLEEFGRRIIARADSIRSYGVLPHLAADCAAAAATSESIPAGATPAEIEWIRRNKQQ